MPFGFGGEKAGDDKLKQQSSRTERQRAEEEPDKEEAKLGRDFLRSSATVKGATRPKILLCVSGSVAVVKAPQLAVKLAEVAEVKT